ncbi:MAG: right-handed parallel beta-helix repeat-containing protein [Verrucomicrobiales bacterium]|nr:right-handed parallel beta-helix repeat-containing protein [Verrucomicrobiales bacterium]
MNTSLLSHGFWLLWLMASPLQAEPKPLRVPADHATLQSAIDAAVPGQTVWVAAGTYHESIRMREGVNLRSEGDDTAGKLGLLRAESTVIDGGGKPGPGVEMAPQATLDGFTITGFGHYDEDVWKHDNETQGSEQSHEHIGQPGAPGISARTTCTVRNNIVHHIGYTGIAITGAPDQKVAPVIAHNVCYRNMSGGIGSMAGSTAIIEANHCFENLHAGIGCDAASPIIRNNDCHDNIRAGIGISEGSSPNVAGNRCFHNRRAGIGIRTGAETRPVVDNNECRDNAMAGIGVEEGARPTLRNNRILNNKLVAIGVVGGSEAVIQGNELSRESGMPPMIAVLGGSRATITGNTIRGGGIAAILVKGRAEVSGNHFIRNSPTAKPPVNQAVWVHDGGRVELGENTIEGWKKEVTAAQGAELVRKP